MRNSPSITPHGPEKGTYLVLEDFGPPGRYWRASDDEDTDRDTLIRDLFSGEYTDLILCCLPALKHFTGASRSSTAPSI
jgi:hypothetical protein